MSRYLRRSHTAHFVHVLLLLEARRVERLEVESGRIRRAQHLIAERLEHQAHVRPCEVLDGQEEHASLCGGWVCVRRQLFLCAERVTGHRQRDDEHERKTHITRSAGHSHPQKDELI